MHLLSFLLCLLSAAHADVSDSGNLTIGGQGVIAGSMTVQGSAFSVGGTTFSVNGGSVTLGGRLNAAVAGIKWADGSTSTTASSGSQNSGSFTVPSGSTMTLDVGANCSGMWCVAASSDPFSTSSVTFSGLKSSTTYELIVNASWLTSVGYADIHFNNDTTSGRYRWGGWSVLDNESTGTYGHSSDSKCRFAITTPIAVSGALMLRCAFAIDNLNASSAFIKCEQWSLRDPGPVHELFNGTCTYTGTNVSSISLKASAGAYRGALRLMQLGK